MDQVKMPLGMEVGLGPGDFVLDGDPALAPKFSAHVYCAETARWIEMAFGMEVCLSLGDFVRCGSIPLPKKETKPPVQFSAHFYCGQTAGCIKTPLGMEV